MTQVKVEIMLEVPESFEGVGCWNREQSLESFIWHWVTEGYYINDGFVDLPHGIEFKGLKIMEGEA